MNTYDLQRAIRDDSSLNAGEVAVLFVLSTYLPHAAPSVAAIAQGCRMTAKSVRRILRRLDGRWIKRTQRAGKRTLYTFDPPLENPPLETPGVFEYQGAFRGSHPPLETPPEETRKRQEQETNNQTDCKTARDSQDSHAVLVELDDSDLVEVKAVAATPPPIPAEHWTVKWHGVWSKVCGKAPLPPLAKLDAYKATEQVFGTVLCQIAKLKRDGDLRKTPIEAFWGLVRRTAASDPATLSLWSPAGVEEVLVGVPDKPKPQAWRAPTKPKHDPDAKPVDTAWLKSLDLFGIDEEQKKRQRAVMGRCTL